MNKFNFKGYRVQFRVGVKNDMVALSLVNDDGTYANYLIIEFNNVPYAAVPIVDRDGLGRMIFHLKEIYKHGFKDKS